MAAERGARWPVPPGEQGAALLSVLLLVAVIAVMAATALERLQIATRLSANAGAIEEARGYAMAAEVLATRRVSAQLSRNPDRVSLIGGWSDRPVALPVPNGVATARVRDASGCFNLNGLVTRDGDGRLVVFLPAVRTFARLIRLIRAPGQPEAIAAAAADWIDSDAAPIQGGQEDPGYAGHRTGGTLMADPSELRAVAGVSPEAYAAIRPWVCTLPVAEPVRINVNTLAPERAPLLAMLAPETLSPGAVQAVLAGRPATGWESPAAFWNELSLAGATADQFIQSQTAVSTHWFDLTIDVAIGGTTLHETALIDATALPARLVSRQWGEDL